MGRRLRAGRARAGQTALSWLVIMHKYTTASVLDSSHVSILGKTEREQLELIVRGLGGIGLDEQTYPGVTSLPLYDQIVRGTGGQAGILAGNVVGGGLKGVYGHKLKASTVPCLC